MSGVLEAWNRLPGEQAAHQIQPCCGSRAWAERMAALRPLDDEKTLLAACDQACRQLGDADWEEAFASHPRIGESRGADSRSQLWSAEEQRQVTASPGELREPLAEANREYERRFGRIFIICASGKSTEEILEALRRRLGNDPDSELREAREQQRQIAGLRLRKWMAS